VPEYWVVDCTAEAIEVHRDPAPDGYRAVSAVGGDAEVSMVSFPDVRLALRDVFA
jgi:Uma2 family endonuclease